MSRILIIDDNAALREQYAYDLARLSDHEVLQAKEGAEGLRTLEAEPVDCVVLDLEMPGVDGFGVLRGMKEKKISVPVVVYTGTGNYERCVRAVKLGAYSFVDKDEPVERVVQEIANALQHGQLTKEVHNLRRQLHGDSGLVGRGRAMSDLRDQIARAAPIPSPVLILGESGTGKELVAQEFHRLGLYPSGPFVALNCAALPEHLAESELFGHERGAFTGADRLRQGAFETARNGTLFLDEVGELPASAQAKLLRVLETGEFSRLGATATLKTTARVLTATHRNLDDEVTTGRFREDLLYRLNVHELRVPPLRERSEDVPGLLDHFLRLTCERFRCRFKTVDPDVVAKLQSHQWSRNNVRELRNTVERMVLACDGSVIGAEHLPADIGTSGVNPGSMDKTSIATVGGTLQELRGAAELAIVQAALERNNWHLTNTARELGLADHASLSKVMKRHGLKRP
jgi:two-component system, NtrC family, nitrogen regulation response regulator NtrX